MKVEFCLATERVVLPEAFACRYVDLGELPELSYNWWLQSLGMVPRLMRGDCPDIVVCARSKADIPYDSPNWSVQRGKILTRRHRHPGAEYLWWAADTPTFLRLVLFWKFARNLHPGQLWYLDYKRCQNQEEFLHGIWSLWLHSQNIAVEDFGA